MTLRSYEGVIKNLPYLDQAFETKKSTWLKECNGNKLFSDFCEKIFEQSAVKLSRRDLFNSSTHDFKEGLFSIILWGYPRNMRGSTFLTILGSLDLIQSSLSTKKHITHEEFCSFFEKLRGSGMGLSTLTKALYFFRFTLEGKRCLILDRRIIEVINDKIFTEFGSVGKITDFNKINKYWEYLEKIHEIATNTYCEPDQVEQFLFLFGKNLKGD